jgi:hypothetical protein
MGVQLLLFVSLALSVEADWNSDKYLYPDCTPAGCAVDGVCYCSDERSGWYNGGLGYSRDLRNKNKDSYCYKPGSGDCLCMDCGQANTQCQDLRCNDETEIAYNGPNGDSYCYTMDPVKGEVKTDRGWYFGCYTKENNCDLSKCEYGEALVGCMRVSSGACQSCGVLPSGKYWTTRGACGQLYCDTVDPGWYMTTSCGVSSNSAKSACEYHTGNPRASAFPNPVPQYYCPGGTTAPVHVPEHGVVNQAYSDFNCLPGYYKLHTQCTACLPGSACLHDKTFTCKANYYTDRAAQSECKRCTASCTYETQLPMRCKEGSIQNSHCVACGMCGVFPTTGVNCVGDLEQFQALPTTCTPMDTSDLVGICQPPTV